MTLHFKWSGNIWNCGRITGNCLNNYIWRFTNFCQSYGCHAANWKLVSSCFNWLAEDYTPMMLWSWHTWWNSMVEECSGYCKGWVWGDSLQPWYCRGGNWFIFKSFNCFLLAVWLSLVLSLFEFICDTERITEENLFHSFDWQFSSSLICKNEIFSNL